MKNKKVSSSAAAVLLIFFICGCADDYPLVANGYSKTSDLSALDNQGFGNFAQPIPPKGCLLAFKAMPDLATMQIRVYRENELDRTYGSAELSRALDGGDFSKGIFVLDDAGIHFVTGYECDAKIR